MENKTYCRECKKPTVKVSVGYDSVCSGCGLVNTDTKLLSKVMGWAFILGWVLAILFFVLWLLA